MAKTPEAVHTLTSSETIMPDDGYIYAGYVYIADGRFVRSDYHGVSVAEWKRLMKFSEVRRCDLFAHPGACLGDRVEAKVVP